MTQLRWRGQILMSNFPSHDSSRSYQVYAGGHTQPFTHTHTHSKGLKLQLLYSAVVNESIILLQLHCDNVIMYSPPPTTTQNNCALFRRKPDSLQPPAAAFYLQFLPQIGRSTRSGGLFSNAWNRAGFKCLFVRLEQG